VCPCRADGPAGPLLSPTAFPTRVPTLSPNAPYAKPFITAKPVAQPTARPTPFPSPLPSLPPPSALDCTKYCALYMDAPRSIVGGDVALHTLHLPNYFTMRFDIRAMTPTAGQEMSNLLSLSGMVSVHMYSDGALGLFYGMEFLALPSLLPPVDWTAWTTIYVTVAAASSSGTADISVRSSASGSIHTAQVEAVTIEHEDMELFLSNDAWPSAGGQLRNFGIYGSSNFAPPAAPVVGRT
jgi:hypothetical protein